MLSIANDYSASPAGRYPADGPFNGERFRDQVLAPALRDAISKKQKLVVDLDGAFSYSSSFLEEAFGGLVRTGLFSPREITDHLELRSNDPIYASFVKDAKSYLRDALKAAAH
ncbi:DUF4325 domain-containing protein [Bradyrhizobium sp. CCBAU 51765]|nr:DUF4325 domain-containing protein [Bradyrhizobium sp. CCBAU 51765]